MRFIIIFLLTVSLYAQDKEYCYSVQLVSDVDILESRYNLLKKKFQSSCKILKIDKRLKVRCGCFDTKAESLAIFKDVTKGYKDAYITKIDKTVFLDDNNRININKSEFKPKIIEKPVAKIEPKVKIKSKPKVREKSVEIIKPQKSTYQQGMEAYKTKNYPLAIEFFKQSKTEYSNVEMQIVWAKSELARKNRRDYAIAAYERVMMLEPDNVKVAKELVNIYTQNGQEEDANELLGKFKQLSPKKSKKERLGKFSALVGIKLGYDSNIASRPEYNSINQFSQKIESAWYAQSLFSLNYFHDLEKKYGWFVKLGTTGMLKINSYSTLYNTKYINLNSAIGYKKSTMTITVPISYSFTSYLDKNLLNNYSISPSISATLQSKYILSFIMKTDIKRYIPQVMKSYNSNSYKGIFSVHYLFQKNYLYSKLFYEKNRADDKIKNSDEFSSLIGMKYRFETGYMLFSDYTFSAKKYREKVSNSENRREDNNHKIGVKLSKEIFKATTLTLDYTYTKNSSNYNMTDYNKYDTSLGINYRY